jgi:hypothetical protein
MIDAQKMIDSAEELAKQMYRNCSAQERLAFQVGLLQSKIRELVAMINGK